MKRKDEVTSTALKSGAPNHDSRTGPTPDQKGGAFSDCPKKIKDAPGNTKAAPKVLATAGAHETSCFLLDVMDAALCKPEVTITDVLPVAR